MERRTDTPPSCLAGKFRSDGDEEKETPEQLFDVIQYGLHKFISNEDSTIEDEDIDTILEKSEVLAYIAQNSSELPLNANDTGEYEELVS